MEQVFDPTRISVIMPCYNAAPYVAEAVASVMEQSYPNVELIVVDDGSTDASVRILEDLAFLHGVKIRLLFQDRMGPYPARNLGLVHASGGKIAFLDADDWWDRECLAKLDAALESHRADIAYCGWQNVGKGAPGGDPYVPPDYRAMDTAVEFLRACPWPIHAALVRRTTIDAVRGFSERRFSAMDYDLWLRLYGHTDNIVRVPEVLAFYRWHGHGQISKARWKQVLDAIDARRNFVKNYPARTSHLPRGRIDELTRGTLLREAYRAYWQRDLGTAQPLFRRAFWHGLWQAADLKYLGPSLLPAPIFKSLVRASDRLRDQGQ